MTIMGDNAAEDEEITEALGDVEIMAIPITDMTIKHEDLDAAKDNSDSNYSRGLGHDNSYRGRGRQWDGNDSNNHDRDNRDRNYDSQGNSNRDRRWDNNSRGQGHNDRGRGR